MSGAQDNLFGELISSYTRAQAIEDGVLVDVSEPAREAGFRYPVALTRAAWELAVAVPEGVTLQDEPGRLLDVLSVLRFAIRCGPSRDKLCFKVKVYRTTEERRAKKPSTVTLKSLCGPGDTAEPVITVMLPEED